jgi:uncharacterized protein
MRIGLLSDTHSYLDERILEHFKDCDELWHAGDVGDEKVLHQLEAFKPVKAVYGNIDSGTIKQLCPLDLRFDCEGIDVWMTHIGGYPGKYNKRVRDIMKTNPPKLFICGHSHILKVMPDRQYDLLHINPGACGQEGFHQVRTIIRFSISDKKIHHLEVIELGKRG